MNVLRNLVSCLIAASAVATSMTGAYAGTTTTSTVPEPYEPGNCVVQSWNIHKVSKDDCSNKKSAADKEKCDRQVDDKHQS